MTTATSPGVPGQTAGPAATKAGCSGCGGCGRCGGPGCGDRRRRPGGASTPAGVNIRTTRTLLTTLEAVKDKQVDVTVFDTHGGAGTFREQFESLVKELGGAQDPHAFGTIREIKVDPKAIKSIAMAAGPHPDHTDGTFDASSPSHFLLGVQTPDTDPNSGRTVLKSVRHLLSKIPTAYGEALKRAEIRYARTDEDGRVDTYDGHILEPLPSGEFAFRWRHDDQVRPEVVYDAGYPIVEAIEWVRGYLRETSGVRLTLLQGQILVIKNFRVTHGRDPLSGLDSPRLLLRAWIKRED